MRLALLLDRPRALAAARLTLGGSAASARQVRLMPAGSWRELERWAKEERFDLALVQFCFGAVRPHLSGACPGQPSPEQFERLAAFCPPERVVLYVCPATEPASLRDALERLGFSFFVVEGEEPGGAIMLRALARATLRRAVRERCQTIEGEGDAPLGAILRIAAGWPPVKRVAEVARQEATSVRNLQRRFARNGLPPPGRVLSWGLLLETCILINQMGITTLARAAAIVNLSDPSSLTHLSRRLTCRPPTGFAGPSRTEDAVGRFLEVAFVSAPASSDCA